MKKKTYNLTTNFALPLLGWKRADWEPYLINAYIRHDGVEHFLRDHIFVLLKEGIDERYKNLEDTIVKHRSHVTQYYVDDTEEYSMHVFRFVNEILPDYNLFLQGSYSQISEGAKSLIKKSSKSRGTNWEILSKSPRLREYQEKKIGQPLKKDEEVWPTIFDQNSIDKEVFTNELFESIKELNH